MSLVYRKILRSLTDKTDRYVSTIFVGERVLNALTHRNSFEHFKAGKKTLILEPYVAITFEVKIIEVYRHILPVNPAYVEEWCLSR